MKYLVMECRPDYAVLLDEAGRFRKAANLHYQVGDMVENPVLMRDAAEKHGPRLRWIASGVAALAACLVLVLGLRWYQAYSTVYSSVYLYINPEVRLDLNSRGTVVELEGLNEDGRQLLDGYSGKGKDKVTVSDELIDRAIAMGFLSEGGVVVISLDTPDEQLFQEYGVELRTQVSAFLEDRLSVTLEVIPYRGDPGTESQEGSTAASTAPEAEPTTAAPAEMSTAAPPPTTASPSTEVPPATSAPPATTAAPADTGDSGYGDSAYGDSGYGEPTTSYVPPATQPAENAGGDSGYEATSPYQEPEEDSGYEEAAPEPEGDSGYEAASPYSEPEEGNSGYEEEGDSSYDEND